MRTIGWALLAITSFFTIFTVSLKAAQRAIAEALRCGNFDLIQALSEVASSGCYAYLLVVLLVWLFLLVSSANHY